MKQHKIIWERPFQCCICEYKTYDANNLKEHMAGVHKLKMGVVIFK